MSLWDGLRGLTIARLLRNGSEDSGGVVIRQPFAVAFISKHFDAVKNSLSVLGFTLNVEVVEADTLLISVSRSNDTAITPYDDVIRGARDCIRKCPPVDVAALIASLTDAAKHCLKCANRLESSNAGISLGALTSVDGVPASVAMEMLAATSEHTPRVFSDAEVALVSSIDAIKPPSGTSVIEVNADPVTTEAVVYQAIFAALQSLSGTLAEAAGGALAIGSFELLAAVVAHQRRLLSSSSLPGPRLCFPLSILEQMLVFAASHEGKLMSEAAALFHHTFTAVERMEPPLQGGYFGLMRIVH